MLDFVIDSLEKGGWVLLPIFLASLTGWILVLGKTLELWSLGLPGRWVRRLRNDPSAVARFVAMHGKRYRKTVAGQALLRLEREPVLCSQEHLENVFDEVMRYQTPRLDRNLSLLSVIASMAPLLGLLGTVSGMIGTFRVIGSFGTSNPALMADSIAEALVTTQDGLVVAFPLMILHLFLYNRMLRIEQDANDLAFRYIFYRSQQAAEEAQP